MRAMSSGSTRPVETLAPVDQRVCRIVDPQVELPFCHHPARHQRVDADADACRGRARTMRVMPCVAALEAA